jgi:hypothetical protein
MYLSLLTPLPPVPVLISCIPPSFLFKQWGFRLQSEDEGLKIFFEKFLYLPFLLDSAIGLT